ncbi:MAG: hypothetical protein ACREDC_11220 [Bradyrhizobium sp.]
MVRAIEDRSRQREFSRLCLYTTAAASFYAGLGWSGVDRPKWRGSDMSLMTRDL